MARSMRARRAQAAMELANPEHDEAVWMRLLGMNAQTAMDYGRTLLALRAMYIAIEDFASRDVIPEATSVLDGILRNVSPEVRELLQI